MTGLEHVQAVVEDGQDLTEFLSDKIHKPNSYDLLLSDWGIHHMHLRWLDPAGKLTPRDRDELVFALFTREDAYFIDVLDHRSFVEIALLEILRANWPHLIPLDSRFTANDLTKEERSALRSKNASALITFSDGAVALPPGGGMVAAGLPREAIIATDWLLANVEACEQRCRRVAGVMRLEIRAKTGMDLKELFLHLNLRNGVVLERQTGFMLPAPGLSP